ncbi:hypothetical protein PR048_018891 [Dryococelus australis]|uniref:STI1 domain-containing protein n=1 Tax=Dryococelus australis TaxID=614101 RepID=A0ABQ9H211_9NEOP|nr:hypothetical protein PR048_018891 [Dryococelus australis]
MRVYTSAPPLPGTIPRIRPALALVATLSGSKHGGELGGPEATRPLCYLDLNQHGGEILDGNTPETLPTHAKYMHMPCISPAFTEPAQRSFRVNITWRSYLQSVGGNKGSLCSRCFAARRCAGSSLVGGVISPRGDLLLMSWGGFNFKGGRHAVCPAQFPSRQGWPARGLVRPGTPPPFRGGRCAVWSGAPPPVRGGRRADWFGPPPPPSCQGWPRAGGAALFGMTLAPRRLLYLAASGRAIYGGREPIRLRCRGLVKPRGAALSHPNLAHSATRYPRTPLHLRTILSTSSFLCILYMLVQARKLEEHRRKYERKHAEKELREKMERARRAKEEHARAASQGQEQPEAGAGGDSGDFYKKMMNDPEIMQAFMSSSARRPQQLGALLGLGKTSSHPAPAALAPAAYVSGNLDDPEVSAAFQDVIANPANLAKYQNVPKIKSVINKLMSKFGGAMPAGGFPGMPGGFPGMPGGFPGGFPPPPPAGGAGSAPREDDVGLD